MEEQPTCGPADLRTGSEAARRDERAAYFTGHQSIVIMSLCFACSLSHLRDMVGASRRSI